MGAEAYLVRHDNKTMFEIGRYFGAGSLADVFGGDQSQGAPVRAAVLPPVEKLTAKLLRQIQGHWSLENICPEQYARELAERIHRFADGRPLDCLHENDAWALKGYTTTDVRYSDAWSYYDVFRLLPQRTRRSIQGARGALKHLDYVQSIRLDESARQQFLQTLRFAGKPPLVKRSKPKKR